MLTVTACQHWSKYARRVSMVVLAAIVILGTGRLRAGDEPVAKTNGILPETVPGELTGAIAALPDNWKDWGNALTNELSALYEKPDADTAAQRQAIAALRRRVAAAREHITDPRYRSILNVLVTIASGLERRLDVIEAALDTSSDNAQLRDSLKNLLTALEDYESRNTGSAAAVRKQFDTVRSQAPDGSARVEAAIRRHYLNYNLRVAASEAYLNKFIDESRNQAGPVRDFILGADVYGNQTTHTDISLKLAPSAWTAQFDVVANGQVVSSTLGYTDQATIATSGDHSFTAAKRVNFDGERLSTQPARITVNPNNTTTDAETNINFPILRGIARGIAMSRAEEMRPESEAIAASRVRDKVLPQFNSQVDSNFGRLNADLAARLDALRELNLYPDAKLWSTTDSELKVVTRLMGPGEMGGSLPSPAMYLGRGVTVLMHDSLMNNYLDTLDFAGKTMTDDEIKSKIEAQFSKLLGRDVKLSHDKPPAAEESSIKKIVFDNTEPLRVHADDGMLVLTIRAGFQQESKEDIPTQIITLPLKYSVEMKNLVLEPGEISIEAAEKSDRPAQQLARAGVIRKRLDAAFPRREIDRVHYVQRDNRNVLTAITRIRALDGWLSVTYE